VTVAGFYRTDSCGITRTENNYGFERECSDVGANMRRVRRCRFWPNWGHKALMHYELAGRRHAVSVEETPEQHIRDSRIELRQAELLMWQNLAQRAGYGVWNRGLFLPGAPLG